MKYLTKIEKTFEHFSEHKNWGYTIDELMERLQFDRKTVKRTLKFLLAIDAIKEKRYGSTDFYIYKQMIDVQAKLRETEVRRQTRFLSGFDEEFAREELKKRLHWKGLLDENTSPAS
jgi:hypothetical protein